MCALGGVLGAKSPSAGTGSSQAAAVAQGQDSMWGWGRLAGGRLAGGKLGVPEKLS